MQGLKIAVAAFIALTVILTVTSYFLYQAYSAADAKYQSASEDVNKKNQANSLALTQYEEVRGRVGTKAQEHDQTKEEIAAHFKKVDQRLDTLINSVNTAVSKRPVRAVKWHSSWRRPSRKFSMIVALTASRAQQDVYFISSTA